MIDPRSTNQSIYYPLIYRVFIVAVVQGELPTAG
jgi:hypothetical protein